MKTLLASAILILGLSPVALAKSTTVTVSIEGEITNVSVACAHRIENGKVVGRLMQDDTSFKALKPLADKGMKTIQLRGDFAQISYENYCDGSNSLLTNVEVLPTATIPEINALIMAAGGYKTVEAVIYDRVKNQNDFNAAKQAALNAL